MQVGAATVTPAVPHAGTGTSPATLPATLATPPGAPRTAEAPFTVEAQVYAAPRTRPPGMDLKVPYEPRLDGRTRFTDWVTVRALEAFHAVPGLAELPSWFLRIVRGGKDAPIQGTPGADRPDPADARRVAFLSDMGEGSAAQAKIAGELMGWQPDAVATGGDNVYPTGRERDWQRNFDPYYGELTRAGKVRPALGNHDYYRGDLTPYFSRFPQLDGKAYYRWSEGPAEFFVLDTEQRLDRGSAQRGWLAKALQESDARFKVLQIHRPMRSSLPLDGSEDLMGSLGPLLAANGVQLVLAGHQHGYERSKPIKGTIHVTAGGGGATTGVDIGQLPDDTQIRTQRHHWVQLTYDDDEMVVRTVLEDGDVLDTFTVSANEG